MELTRKEVIEIIGQHGFGPYECTNGDHTHMSDTLLSMPIACGTFSGDVGLKDNYTFREVKNWLGY